MPKWVLTVLLNWVWGKASDLFAWYMKKRKLDEENKALVDANAKQAMKVKMLAEEIRLMIQRGEVVPELMKERLREESRLLIHGPTDPNGSK